MAATAVVLVALAMTLAPQLFTRRDPNAIVFLERLQPPSLAHALGTDENGRDLWARVVYGARPTLAAAVSLIVLSLTVGSLAGLGIGYAGRRTDEALMRVTEFFLAFPQIVWALAITSVIGRGLVDLRARPEPHLVGSVRAPHAGPGPCLSSSGSSFWPRRLSASTRGGSCCGTCLPNCLFARARQGHHRREPGHPVAGRAVVPGCRRPAADAGVGRDGDDRTQVPARLPWYATFPGLAIFVVVLAFNILGERVRDALDPASSLCPLVARRCRRAAGPRRLPLLVCSWLPSRWPCSC